MARCVGEWLAFSFFASSKTLALAFSLASAFRPPSASVGSQATSLTSSYVGGADRYSRPPSTQLYLLRVGDDLQAIDSSAITSATSKMLKVYSKETRQSKRRIVRTMFETAKDLERQGKWRESTRMLQKILQSKDPSDSHTHLALARLEARRERPQLLRHQARQQQTRQNSNMTTPAPFTSKAREAFRNGTDACPLSVHLWQAWAVYEETHHHDTDRARELFDRALQVDDRNAYACHAYGRMELQNGNTSRARELFERGLSKTSTAALVCSLGEVLIQSNKFNEVRQLYERHLPQLATQKEKTEVYLAWAWLEEKYYDHDDRALELIKLALSISPHSGLAHVALARLEGRLQMRKQQLQHHVTSYKNKIASDIGDISSVVTPAIAGKDAAIRRLASACIRLDQKHDAVTNTSDDASHGRGDLHTEFDKVEQDGRLFNTWANLEMKAGRLPAARKILRKGIAVYPKDHSLYQAAGKVEERAGNYTGARTFYANSLHLEPSTPTLVAYALLEAHGHISDEENKSDNGRYARAKQLLEEALMLDPGHGPAYNAYGNLAFQHGEIEVARSIYERGMRAKCSDVASLYHGYGKMELSLGNVDKARTTLMEGLDEVRRVCVGMDSPRRDRAKYLFHTLGMIELNSNRPKVALDVFEDGIARCGNSSQLLLGAALCEVKLGNEDSARILFERSVLSDKEHAQAWQAWGLLETRAGNFKMATSLFKCGIKSSPNHAPLWHAYATMETKRGNMENARVLFKTGLRKAPGYTVLYRGWAALELREGNHRTARRLITTALTRDKHDGPSWLLAARIEGDLGNDGLTLLLLRRGVECAPDYPGLYRALGEYLVTRGKIDAARDIMEKGIEINYRYAPLYHSLAELEARIFNVAALSALHKRAAAIFNNNATATSDSPMWAPDTKIGRLRNFRGKKRQINEDDTLSQRIVEEDEKNDDKLKRAKKSPTSDVTSAKIMEDDLVNELLGADPVSDEQ